MSRKRLWIAALSALLMIAASAAAQDEKNEIGVTIGRIFISNQGLTNSPGSIIAFGKGLTFDVDYARRFLVTPLYSVSAEVPFVVDHKNLLNAGSYGNSIVPQSFSSFFITPAARVNLFPTTAVSPWVSLGIGVGHFGEYKTLLYGGSNPGGSSTGFTLEGGLGLDVKVWKQLSIRGGVRDFWSGEPDFPLAPTGKSRMHNFYVFGGGFWRF
jgi:opacity protein-like surface antigen